MSDKFFDWVFSKMKIRIEPLISKVVVEELAKAKKGLLADIEALFIKYHLK